MSRKFALLAFFLGACAAQALAASNIVYVSFYGSDSFPCTRLAPCKTIAHALSVVAYGGEVDIVGSGVYDNFTITKAVTVAAEPGVLASFDVPASSNGITIATAGDGHGHPAKVESAWAGRREWRLVRFVWGGKRGGLRHRKLQ